MKRSRSVDVEGADGVPNGPDCLVERAPEDEVVVCSRFAAEVEVSFLPAAVVLIVIVAATLRTSDPYGVPGAALNNR